MENNISKRKKFVFYIFILFFVIGLPIVAGELLVRFLSPAGIVTPETVYNESVEYIPSLFARSVIRPEDRVLKKQLRQAGRKQ